MKNLNYVAWFAVLIACPALVITGCGKSDDRLDTNWTPSVAVSSSIGSLSGWLDLHRCHNTIIAISVFRDGSPYGLILNPDQKSWSELSFVGAPIGYIWSYAAINPQNQQILSA
jgi:hypothetical protein